MPETTIPDYLKEANIPTEYARREDVKPIQSPNLGKVGVTVNEAVEKTYVEGSIRTEPTLNPYTILRPKREIIKAKRDKGETK